LDDVRFVKEGIIAFVRRSKTDQHGEGIKKGVPYGSTESCPVRALQHWIEAAGLDHGPVFRRIDRHGNIGDKPLSGNAIALIVKRAALAAGLDPSEYAGHSLRSGLATQAAMSGVNEAAIVRQGAWKTERMARRYVREGSLFRDNAASQVGL
jgi:integrase